jgi:hypothetical protein
VPAKGPLARRTDAGCHRTLVDASVSGREEGSK